MNSLDLQHIRTLLTELTITERPLVLSKEAESEDDSGYVDCPYSNDAINWMITNNLILQVDELESRGSAIHVFEITEIGRMVSYFKLLANYCDLGDEEYFVSTGNQIFAVLKKYNENEIDPLVKILTQEEQEAYQHFYRTQIWNAIGGRDTNDDKAYTREEALEAIVSGKALKPMFGLSVLLGNKDSNDKRTNDYVLKKCMEELGELALELQIEDNLSYKEAGEDGVAGEAVDLAITAMDMFALQHPDHDAETIERLFYAKMNEKLEKWKRTIGM